MERIADVLARKFPHFNTVTPDHLVSDALYQMCVENLEYLIVVQEDSFSGIITSADIANKVLFIEKPLNKIKVKEFINRSLPIATLNDSLEYGLQLLKQHGSKYLAIYDHFDFKGVLSSEEVMQFALASRNNIFEEPSSVEQTFTWSY